MNFPRVTEILKSFTSYENVPSEILRNAAARGSSVHAICAGIAKGAWIPDSMIDENLQGYVKSFKHWADAYVTDFVVIEKRYTDSILGYTGQLDFVILDKDQNLFLIDLKTSAKPQKTYPVQMAAYDNLLKESDMHVKGAMLVYLNKTGEFPAVHVMDNFIKEFHVFKCALQCWKFFKKRKKDEPKIESTPENVNGDD